MSNIFIDLTGVRFGRWLVVGRGINDRTGRTRWVCRCDCGMEKVVQANHLRNGVSKSCGCFHNEEASRRASSWKLEKHPSWRGGRRKVKQGYVLVAQGNNIFRREHCLVMEDFLGRKLNGKETVHHKNGIRDDNRLENLELWASSHPPGQRIEDLKSWAKEILRRYPDIQPPMPR